MRRGIAAGAALAALALAGPAGASVVEITTSIPLAGVGDDTPELTTAIQSAVDEALHPAIAFRPTLVALTKASVVGERLYVRVLAADEDGERELGHLMAALAGRGPDEGRGGDESEGEGAEDETDL